MFYLLEDNRIIDSSNLEKEKMKYIKFPTKDKPYNQGSYLLHEDIQYIKIKKQSENVCDLIEVGDLVAQKKIFGYKEIYNVSLVCGKDDKLIKCFYCTMFEDKVVAIYKPNSKGDYIKVWGKKDDK